MHLLWWSGQAVDEVTRRSGGQAPIIVGHSIGGGVAQVYATDSLLSRKIAGLVSEIR